MTGVPVKVPYARAQAWILVSAAGGLAGAVAFYSWHSSHELQAAIALAALVGALLIDKYARRGLANSRDSVQISEKRPRSRIAGLGGLVGTILIFALPGSLQLVMVGFADGVLVGLVVRGCLSGELKARFRGYGGVWPRVAEDHVVPRSSPSVPSL